MQVRAVRLSPFQANVHGAASPSMGGFHALAAAPIPDGPPRSKSFVTTAPAFPLELDTAQWAAAAADFTMNADFDISQTIAAMTSPGRHGAVGLKALLDVMKNESAGKRTIQALADKLILSAILENLDVAHMPTLLATRSVVSQEQVSKFLERSFKDYSDCEVVGKPTHLSNGAGVIIIRRPQPQEWVPTVDGMVDHMNQFMRTQALPTESIALRSLQPGYIAQPKYVSSIRFDNPLELRIIALWGKARMGIWWWGRAGDQTSNSHRNTWIVRRPVRPDVLSDDDCWEVIHEHTKGSNVGFDMALEVLKRDMPKMAATTEKLASAVGAPFLRVDFFVGSSRWGVRLNEVAYGCGCEYRNRTSDGQLIDDAAAMARIIQDGYAQRPNVRSPSTFLSKVGVHGESYNDMTVIPVSKSVFDRTRWADWADLFTTGTKEDDQVQEEQIVPEDLCKTSRGPPRASPRASPHGAFSGYPRLQGSLKQSLPQSPLLRQALRASQAGPFKGVQPRSAPFKFHFSASAAGGA